MKNQCKHLTEIQRNEFLEFLQKPEELFDEILGNWKKDIVKLELKRIRRRYVQEYIQY